LGLNPENCLVVEDAVSGVAAGKAAGCSCLALTTSFPAENLSSADLIRDSLEGKIDEILRDLSGE
jgi:sugar-phosphatase